MENVWKEYEHVLSLGRSTRQPLVALDLIPTENHARTGAVPVDGGHLSIVHVKEQFRALRVARDGVERPASCIDHDGIHDLRATIRKSELD